MTQPHREDELPPVSVVTLSEPPPPNSSEGSVLLPGQVLSERYEIIRPLAAGGTATVYLAKHNLIDRQVAIKLLDAAHKGNDKLVKRFMNEGRAVGALGHPHIVESTDLGFTPDGTPFLVLEYLEGCELAEEIEASGPMDILRVVRIGSQIASALAAAHAKGIVHRDMKSENIFLVQKVGQADHVKVLDFGISKFSTAAGATEAGEIFGTADFLSPEQIGATNAVDTRTDVYSLGVILYHMITGHLPYETVDFPAVLHSIVNEPPPPMSNWRADVPGPLAEITLRCMQKKPEHRYQTMAELGSDLSAMLETRPSSMSLNPSGSSSQLSLRPPADGTTPQSTRTGVTIRNSVQGSLPPGGPAITGMTPMAPPPSSNKRWAVAAVAAVVAIGAGIGLGTSLGQADAPTATTAAAATPDNVSLRIDSPVNGTVTFRGREHMLPFKQDVRTSAEKERLDVKLESGKERSLWLTVDQPRRVFVAAATEK